MEVEIFGTDENIGKVLGVGQTVYPNKSGIKEDKWKYR